jgi:hypothetical protein
MKRGPYFLLVAGTIVGRTVWTVSVNCMEVGLPDISTGEKVTIAMVVVNELVIPPRLDAVEVESFVVLGTGSTRATLLALNRLDQIRRKA